MRGRASKPRRQKMLWQRFDRDLPFQDIVVTLTKGATATQLCGVEACCVDILAGGDETGVTTAQIGPIVHAGLCLVT